MISAAIDRSGVAYALVASLALNITVAGVGGLSSGYFGAPVPYGDSGGITFDLLGGFFNFFWPFFLLDVALISIPLYLFIRPLPPGRVGRLVALLILGVLLVCGPLIEIAWSGTTDAANWTEAAVDATLVLIAGSMLAAIGRNRTGS